MPRCVAVTILLISAAAALGQWPGPPLPARGVAPLLHVRLAGPEGARVSFYQGRAPARTFPARWLYRKIAA